ncbi:MAG: hypothetical protein PHU93_04540 [Candidatus Gracilibacteria bacterium]|nr:hypothetical protein [Candidatus Gracilibacteria bacterium]
MKKIFPAVTSVALASILVSCGATTPVEPIPLSPKIETPTAEVTPTAPVVAETIATGAVVTPEAVPAPVVDTMVNPLPVVAGTGSASVPTDTKIVSQVVNYKSPAGDESIKVTIETSNGIISSVTATPMATHEVSKKLQTSFSTSIGVAVGKPIASFKLDTVGGASLTTKAFNEYVQSL